ncbi:unnamed protein product [Schistosoma intercalatum]|nr:unnamed protein product [Schistosoma intercalatum]CAH8571608.1 unnamed protein product [Schistosoma intercalatum]
MNIPSTSFILLLKIKAVISIACRHFCSTSCTFNNADVVLISQHKSCGIITLNRPKVHNSLNLEMLGIIHSKLKDWNHDPSVSLVVIEGSGEKAFCAGGDVRFIASAVQKGSIAAQEFFRKEYQLNHLIGVMTKPYIAILNGITMGGGAGISVHGRYRIATEKTVFAMPETMIGFFPDVGGGYFLPRLPHPGLGLFLALTGYKLSSMNTVWAGIATHFIHSKDLSNFKNALMNLELKSTCSSDDKPEFDYAIDKVINQFSSDVPSYYHSSVSNDLLYILDDLSKIFCFYKNNDDGGDHEIPVTIEDILIKLSKCYQNIENHEKVIHWAKQTYDKLLSCSPTSLKVTLHQLQIGSKLSFSDEFKMEYRLSQKMTKNPDFYEGVRACLIDKDNTPKWNPNNLTSVDMNQIQSYFNHLPENDEWRPE